MWKKFSEIMIGEIFAYRWFNQDKVNLIYKKMGDDVAKAYGIGKEYFAESDMVFSLCL